jgi:hypothetical protein
VQLTPPGSACSVVLGTGITDMPPGSQRGCRWSSPTRTPPARSWPTAGSR